ncbi:hypothetical protein F5Y03DRAFT_399145 [Xylaria venustula]|nr:hypothetical protein F5Y03DRAFT_399145 [Xylaria venustula]
MPSRPVQTTKAAESSPTNPNFDASPVNQKGPQPSSTGSVYTGETRLNFRERMQRMRGGQEGLPRLQRRDTPAPIERDISPSPTSEPRTPLIPPSPLECPGAPRKGKASELRQARPICQRYDDEDILLDRKANEKRQDELYRDILGYIAPGWRSPLRDSWGPDQPSDRISEALQQLCEQLRQLGEALRQLRDELDGSDAEQEENVRSSNQ